MLSLLYSFSNESHIFHIFIPQYFLEKRVLRSSFLLIAQWKFRCFRKPYIYLGRGGGGGLKTKFFAKNHENASESVVGASSWRHTRLVVSLLFDSCIISIDIFLSSEVDLSSSWIVKYWIIFALYPTIFSHISLYA